ncbi:molybdopterin-dependent oxidoreductase [Haloechinothrix aidingensis]|uniref:molybdopterin-dependent oxidoreductase n=1 Tax=Haloechinothrix aidingensis TaxID=2752311 RepID=UPI001C6092C4
MSTRTREKRTYCGICEAVCGLIATVDEMETEVSVRPDNDHPLSAGFACAKGMAYPDARNDPDRVTRPLKRQPDGSFAEVDWEQALDEIASRLKDVIDRYGSESVGLNGGNPIGSNYGLFLSLFGMAAALGTKHFYIAASSRRQQLLGRRGAAVRPRTRELVSGPRPH